MAKRIAVAVALIGIAIGAMRLLNRGVPPEVAEGGPPSTNEMANALCDKALRSLRADAIVSSPEFIPISTARSSSTRILPDRTSACWNLW